LKRVRSDTLLSRGNLSGAQREDVLASVLDAVASAERVRARPRVLRWLGGAALALSAAAALLLWVRAPHALDDGLRAKGPGGGPAVHVGCEPGGLGGCTAGGTLLFSIEGAPAGARLAAYAEPATGGERIWYFSGDGESPAVAEQTSDAFLRRGIRLGPEHPAGEYHLTVLVTRVPLPRSVLMAASGADVLAVRRLDLRVVGP
jgi:hypothetical protein